MNGSNEPTKVRKVGRGMGGFVLFFVVYMVAGSITGGAYRLPCCYSYLQNAALRGISARQFLELVYGGVGRIPGGGLGGIRLWRGHEGLPRTRDRGLG